MIEAMACGTPVLAFGCDSVPPEISDEARSGLVVYDVNTAIAAIPALLQMDRYRVRKCFDARFPANRMTNDYLAVYRSLLERGARQRDSIEQLVSNIAGSEAIGQNTVASFNPPAS